MPPQPAAQTASDPAADPAQGSQEERISRLETGQERILGKLDQLISGAHAAGERGTERRLEEPDSVEARVQAELAKAEQKRKAAEAKTAADAQAKTEAETVAQRLAKLEEAPPAQAVKRSTRLMGW